MLSSATPSARDIFSRTAQIVAVSTAILALSACGSSGSVQSSAGGSSGGGGTPITTAKSPFTPIQEAIQETAEGSRAIPAIAEDVGDTLGGVISKTPLAPRQRGY